MKWSYQLFIVIAIAITVHAFSQDTLILQPGHEGKDAQLWSIQPDNNFGESPKCVCSGWTHGGVPGINRSLLDFDLSAIPENAEIIEARLNLSFVCLEPTFFGHTGDNAAYLQLITEEWEENSVTWNTQPAITPEDELYLPPSIDPYQDYTNLNVTALINKIYTQPNSYHGIMLRLLDENPYRCLLFASSDYNDTIEFRPKLEVIYSLTENVVVIQPGAEGKDAQLWSIMPENNYGDIPKFDCSGWTHGGIPGINRGVIDFDLSVIPENAQITDARLNFYFVCLEPAFFGHTGENEACLQLITEPWDEHTVTWNNQPLSTSLYELYLPPSTGPYQDYTDLDVTTLIDKLYTEPDGYHGLMLRLLNEEPYRCLLFASSDYTDTISFRPMLVVHYTMCQEPVIGFSYDSEDLTVYFYDNTIYGENCWWDFGDGYFSNLHNPHHTYDTPGDYQVCLKAWNECGSDSVCDLLPLRAVSIQEKESPSVKIFPNPANDFINITSEINDDAILNLYDMSGRIIMTESICPHENSSYHLNVSMLHPGMYLLRVTSDKEYLTEKIIIYH